MYYRLFMCMFAFTLLAAQAYADDDWMNPSDSGTNAAARQDLKDTMQSDIFNTNPHADAIGSSGKATVMISAKNTKLPDSKPTTESITGGMDLTLTDSASRSVSITLIQSGDVVFGRGSMTSGGVTQDVAATGSLSGGKLNLDMLSMNDVILFKAIMDISGKSLSGSYSAFSSGSPWTGTVVGSLA